jgi:hypothetical protein
VLELTERNKKQEHESGNRNTEQQQADGGKQEHGTATESETAETESV